MIIELIDDYQKLCMNVTALISKSGYKVDYVRERLQMSKPRFYAKRKKGNFAPAELMQIMKIIRLDRLEDEKFTEMMLEHLNDEELTEKQTRKLLLG